jgi:hypothetical protein
VDFNGSLHLKSLTGMCEAGVGSETLDNSSLEESLDKWTRSFGRLSFTKWKRGGWTLDILEGWDKRSVDAAIRVALSLNAL